MSRETKIKDIKIIRSGFDTNNREIEKERFVAVLDEGCIPKSRDAIKFYADEPCVEACQRLYDLNIQTYSSGGHVNGEENATGFAFVGIVYDTLSEENKRIVDDMIASNLIDQILDTRGRNTGFAFNVKVPITSDSLVGEVSDQLLFLIERFQYQDVLYGRKTKEEISNSLFTPLENGLYKDMLTFEEIDEEELKKRHPERLEESCSVLYTDDGELYFQSEDLLKKHLEYVKSLEVNKSH